MKLKVKWLVSLVLIVAIVLLIIKKPNKVACSYSPYFEQLNIALQQEHKGASCAVLDLDRLDANSTVIQQNIGDKFKLRLVAKSLPSLDLLTYLMQSIPTNRLMVFSEPFIEEILDNLSADSLDILLGKPLPVNAVKRLSEKNHWNTIHWLIDTDSRLKEYIELAKEKNTVLKIALEINIGLQRGGYDTPDKLAKAIDLIKANEDYVQLTGLMGYDGHVPFVPFYINKEKQIQKAFADAQKRYNSFVTVLKKYYPPVEISKMTLNSGGSRTYFYYKNYKDTLSVNEIAMGSGFLTPAQFPELYTCGHQPALYLASPVLKKIETALLPHAEKISPLVNWWNPNLKVSYFMIGGGWPGEVVSPSGIQKNSFWDENDKGYSNLLPNQSILSSSDKSPIQVDDFIFTHPWEGDGMLCFSKVLLYRNSTIIGEWKTYNGGN